MSSENAKLVPKLRFPGFREAEGWITKKLKDACDVNPANSALPERFVYVDLESVEAGKLTARKTIAKDEAPSRAQRLLLPDDVIFQIVRPYQRNNFHFKTSEGLDYVASTGYAQLRVKDSADFLFQAVHVDGFVDRVIAKCTGSSYPAINSSDLAEVPLAIPKPDEQKKIADCLSSLDELVAGQARKVDALKTHKKGLMQQLFPREGEAQPRLRFPEFQDAGAWSKRKLSDFMTERSQFPEDKVPLYSLTIENGVTPKTERYERAFLVSDETEAYKLVLPNDFAFNPMNLRFGAIGRHSGTEKVAVSKYYNIFYCDDSVDSRFCEIYFRSDSMVRFYDTMAIGSLIEKRRVHFSDFLKFNIRFPRLSEQQRIADGLAALGDVIIAATQELETIKTHKKGLMQQLFPSAEAMVA